MLLLQLDLRELTINVNSVSNQQGLNIINILSSLGFSNYGMSYRVIQWKLTAFSILNQSSNCIQIFNLIVKILEFFFFFLINFIILERFHNDVTAAILVFQNKERAAMLVYQTKPLGIELHVHANISCCGVKLTWPLVK